MRQIFQQPARDTEVGEQQIALYFDKNKYGVFFELEFSMLNAVICEIAEKFAFITFGQVFCFPVERVLLKISSTDISFSDSSDLSSRIEQIKIAIFPILNEACTISGLNNVMNKTFDQNFYNEVRRLYYMPQALIVAKLAGNPDFERLAIELRDGNFMHTKKGDKLDKWDELVEYLRGI